MAHLDIIMRLAEEARAAGDSIFLPILYDQLLRKNLADRALKRDPELDIEAEFTKVNKEVLALARSRLAITLDAAGVKDKSHQPHGAQGLVASTESVFAKQAAAAEALTRKAEQACRQMAQQQEGLERRRQALESAGKYFPQDQGKGRGKARKLERAFHFQRVKGGGNSKGYGSGKGWQSKKKQGKGY